MTTKFRTVKPLSNAEEADIQRRIAIDPDNPELTDAQLAQAKPFREALPGLAAAMDRELARRGRPPIDNPKQSVTIRLDQDVIAKFTATGQGWQSRINQVLKQAKV